MSRWTFLVLLQILQGVFSAMSGGAAAAAAAPPVGQQQQPQPPQPAAPAHLLQSIAGFLQQLSQGGHQFPALPVTAIAPGGQHGKLHAEIFRSDVCRRSLPYL
jgi:hypothetical protein